VAHLLALIAAVSWAGVLHLLPLFVVVVVGGLKRGGGGLAFPVAQSAGSQLQFPVPRAL